MSERRLLQIIADESRGAEAPSPVVAKKYGAGFKDTLYVLVRRGQVESRPPSGLSLTKTGQGALR